MDKNSLAEHKDVTKQIEKFLRQIEYGSITLIVQDGKIIQIECQEKIRIKKN